MAKSYDAFYIGGQWVAPSSAETIRVMNPATEEQCATVPAGKPADIDRAVAAAREAFDNGPWPRMSPADRIDWIRKLSQGVSARMPDVAMAITESMGCPLMSSQLMQALLESIPRLGDRREKLTAIEGQPPDLARLPGGCAFAPRCPHVMDRCRAEVPPQLAVAPGQVSACWRHASA